MHNHGLAAFGAALAFAATGAVAAPGPPTPGTPYLAEVRAFAFNYCPTGWAPAAGQLMPIVQNTPLFSLLGTTYGGNGTTNFALPDLRGRTPTGATSSFPLGMSGSAQPATTPRFLGMTWCIAVQGAFPGRGAAARPPRR